MKNRIITIGIYGLTFIALLVLVFVLSGCDKEFIEDNNFQPEYYTQEEVDLMMLEQSTELLQFMVDNMVQYNKEDDAIYWDCYITDENTKMCNGVLDLETDYALLTENQYTDLLQRIEELELQAEINPLIYWRYNFTKDIFQIRVLEDETHYNWISIDIDEIDGVSQVIRIRRIEGNTAVQDFEVNTVDVSEKLGYYAFTLLLYQDLIDGEVTYQEIIEELENE